MRTSRGKGGRTIAYPEIAEVYTGARPIVLDISLLHNWQGDKL